MAKVESGSIIPNFLSGIIAPQNNTKDNTGVKLGICGIILEKITPKAQIKKKIVFLLNKVFIFRF